MTGEELRRYLKAGILAGVAIGIMISRNVSSKKLKQIPVNDPSIGQYLNRLVEFFDEENLDQAQDEFLNMVDFGTMPRDAFSILVFSGELN